MMRATTYTLLSLIIVAVAAGGACRREQPQAKSARPAAGGCPKTEGSYLGADKAEAAKGEAFTLTWKLPTAYHEASKIEGLNSSTSVSAAYDNTAETPFVVSKVEGATAEETTRFVLKAAPQGCQPLELTATVYIIEPEGGGRADAIEGGCLDPKKIKFWAAPQAEDRSRVKLMWDAPGAERVEVEGHGTDFTRGSMEVELAGREPVEKVVRGVATYSFSLVSRRQGCQPVTMRATVEQLPEAAK